MKKQPKTYFESSSVMILHTGIMLGVIVQLLTSKLMHGHHHNIFAMNCFYLHRLSGVSIFVMVIFFIGVKIYRGTFWNLYPWHKSGYRAILVDIKLLLTGRIPVRQGVGLARFVQGLGIVVVLAMSALGVTWWLMRTWHLGMPGDARTLIGWHKSISTLVWIYVIGHTTMAFLHWVWPQDRLVELA